MTENATDFLNKLRFNTAPLHKSIELLPVSISLLSNNITLQDYRNYIIILYGFVKEFELSLYPQIQFVIDDLESRKKTFLLYNDLQTLGIEPAEVETIMDNFFKTNNTIAGTLGCMYVMEGATLGGQIISRHIEKMLGNSVTGSLKYIKAYGTNTGYMWKKFLESFCELAVIKQQQDEAIKGAVKTFSLLEKWMIDQSKALTKV